VRVTAERNVAKVLLVDDRFDNVLALEASLQGMPVESVRAFSGDEALKRLLVDDFALILLDVQMPGMDGFETAQHIKRRERTRHVPIIFLTAADREAQLALRGYAAGAVDYITKPFDPWVLRAKVAVFVELWTKTQQLRAHAEAAAALDARLRALDAVIAEAGLLLAQVRDGTTPGGAPGEAGDPGDSGGPAALARLAVLIDEAGARAAAWRSGR
jgi:CheY-like chemotaxis protein